MPRLVVVPVLCLAVAAAAGCRFDPSGEAPTTDGGTDGAVGCGNGVLDPGEICDTDELGGETCEGLGYGGGTLYCAESCTFDESQCTVPPGCGDGVIDAGEECDGSQLGGGTCLSETGMPDGTLTCRASCQYDTTGCHHCGNNIVEPAEDCDGTDYVGRTCESLGHVWGDLGCSSSCQIVETGCFDYPQNWFDLACPYRKLLAVLPTFVDAPLAGFPVLVQRTDAELQALAQSNGSDIRFADESGTVQLPHEIEAYDAATGTITAWVALPAVSDSAATNFYMYYGAVGCGVSATPEAVWDLDYRGVWHLDESGTGDRQDSTTAGLNATTANYGAGVGVVGQAGGADELTGGDDHLELPQAATNGLWDFTLCLWIRTTESRSNAVGWHNPTILGNISFDFYSNDFGVYTSNGYIGLRSGLCSGIDEGYLSPTISINDDLWHYVCAVSEGNEIQLFVDDGYVGKVCGGARAMEPPRFWVGGHSGYDAGSRGDYHQGVYDELRISRIARLPAWRTASFHNQATPHLFLSVGQPEALP